MKEGIGALMRATRALIESHCFEDLCHVAALQLKVGQVGGLVADLGALWEVRSRVDAVATRWSGWCEYDYFVVGGGGGAESIHAAWLTSL